MSVVSKELREVLSIFMLRRVKEDIKDLKLPPKRVVVMYTGMSDMQKHYYKMVLAKHAGQLTLGLLSVYIIYIIYICLFKLFYLPSFFFSSFTLFYVYSSALCMVLILSLSLCLSVLSE